MILIFSAPSGSGKSTIINQLLQENLGLEFSISATSRPPRGKEQNGVEYYFLSTEEFREKIKNNEFVEYEEVYGGRFYGTLKSEITRIQSKGNIPVFDVDVVGGINIKKMYGEEAKSIFIMPPSIAVLRQRLEGRGTDTPEVIEERLQKAEWEISHQSEFDYIVVNDDLEKAIEEVRQIIKL
jgi:guanylate kinase